MVHGGAKGKLKIGTPRTGIVLWEEIVLASSSIAASEIVKNSTSSKHKRLGKEGDNRNNFILVWKFG